MNGTVRTRAALALAVLAAAGAVVIVAPSLHRQQWIARLVLRETSLILLPIAGAGVLVARTSRGRTARFTRIATPGVRLQSDVVLEGLKPWLTADVKCLLGRIRERAAALGIDPDRGREVTFVEVPMDEHGMDARPGGVGEQVARRAVLDFLGARLAR